MDPRGYTALQHVLQETLAGRQDAACALLDALVDSLDAEGRPDELQTMIFASALSRRLASDRQAEINLYLRRFERTQISLFNLLARHLPTVAVAGQVANAVLAEFMAGHDRVALLDVGIGSGRQEEALLIFMAERGGLPERLDVIAVEPDADSLATARATLLRTAEELGVELTFRGIQGVLEELDDAVWTSLAELDAPLVVHAAFAAHHIRSTASSPLRDDLFARLRGLAPQAVVLVEPNSDHHTDSLMERFHNAWHHFGLTFRLIDEGTAAPDDRAAMKMFFAREIEDILANAEDARCERHEAVSAWVRRLRDSGFAPVSEFGDPRTLQNRAVGVVPRDGYVGLEYAGETLVAVVCATSEPGAGISLSAEDALAAIN